MKYITLPVNFHLNTRLQDLTFSNNHWQEQQLSFIRNYYRKSEHFASVYPVLEDLYLNYDSPDACTFIFNTMKVSIEFFGIKVDLKRASECPFTLRKGDLVLEICNHFNADVYFSGKGAQSYMDEPLLKRFKSAGIKIDWQHFIHPVYQQGNSPTVFVEGLSCLDFLFHQGTGKARKLFIKN